MILPRLSAENVCGRRGLISSQKNSGEFDYYFRIKKSNKDKEHIFFFKSLF
jgi:hypothetical protein